MIGVAPRWVLSASIGLWQTTRALEWALGSAGEQLCIAASKELGIGHGRQGLERLETLTQLGSCQGLRVTTIDIISAVHQLSSGIQICTTKYRL